MACKPWKHKEKKSLLVNRNCLVKEEITPTLQTNILNLKEILFLFRSIISLVEEHLKVLNSNFSLSRRCKLLWLFFISKQCGKACLQAI